MSTPGRHPQFGAQHAASYAAGFSARTLRLGRPLEPTDENLMVALGELVRPPREGELADIRDAFLAAYGSELAAADASEVQG